MKISAAIYYIISHKLHVHYISVFSQVGADGANSIVRQQMGVNNFTLNYNQMGLIATVELDEVIQYSLFQIMRAN